MRKLFFCFLSLVSLCALAQEVEPLPQVDLQDLLPRPETEKYHSYQEAQNFSLSALRRDVKKEEKDVPEPRKEVRYRYSIGFGGWSSHKHRQKCLKIKSSTYCYFYHQTNPTVEGDYWLPFDIWGGGQPFIGYGHVYTNSNLGTTDWLTLAVQWKLIGGPYVDLIGGAGAMRGRYTVPSWAVKPGQSNARMATLPVIYLGLQHGPFSMRFVPLGKDILFMYLVYSFE